MDSVLLRVGKDLLDVATDQLHPSTDGRLADAQPLSDLLLLKTPDMDTLQRPTLGGRQFAENRLGFVRQSWPRHQRSPIG